MARIGHADRLPSGLPSGALHYSVDTDVAAISGPCLPPRPPPPPLLFRYSALRLPRRTRETSECSKILSDSDKICERIRDSRFAIRDSRAGIEPEFARPSVHRRGLT